MMRTGCCGNRQYRLRCVHSKGVLLLMVWTFFWYSGQYYNNNITFLIVKSEYFLDIGYAMFLVFPIVGWIADSCLGRYRVIIASVYIGLASWILQGVAYALLTYSLVPLLSNIILYTGIAMNFIGFAGFVASLLPFILDQLVGASGEELSAAVHWWYWSVSLSYTLTFITVYYGVSYFDHEKEPVFYLLASLFCLLFLVVTHLVFKDWLVRKPLLTNPIKHIAKVLNYARKNKHPRNRSALTYWEEDYPSRLDLGKDKYGGPFSEEEVEDVKTVLRLLPLFVCMPASGIAQTALELYFHYTLVPFAFINHLTWIDVFWPSLASVIIIPFYQLVVIPCFYNYIPSMLKRMGTGLLLLALAQCGYAILELVGHSMDSSVHCAFVSVENSNQSQTMPISIAFTIAPQFVNALGNLLLLVTSLEFVVAQTPTRVKAMIIGLWYAVFGLMRLLTSKMHYPFSHIPSPSFPSCGFYYFLTKIVILGSMFLLFLFLSKRYRLRERNIPVNFHMFAENYYDKYIDIERQLEREGIITCYQQSQESLTSGSQ